MSHVVRDFTRLPEFGNYVVDIPGCLSDVAIVESG